MRRKFIQNVILPMFAASSALAQTIVVSPQGPIRTLVEARDEARHLRKCGESGTITILVRGGTYYLPDTLVLGPDDSDTIWESPHGEHPIISGGRLIRDWTKRSVSSRAGAVPADFSTWTAAVPEPLAGSSFHQLFVNGRRATRARMPDNGFFRIDGLNREIDKPEDSRAEVHFRGGDIEKNWAELGDVEVIELIRWSDLRRPIAEVDETKHIAALRGSTWPRRLEKDARYYIENAPDALDRVGEWYFDRRERSVSYNATATENMDRAVVVAPSLVNLVSLEGDTRSGKLVHNVSFRGLTFEHADWTMGREGYIDLQAAYAVPAAIETVGTENFTMDHCTIAHSGGYGVSLGRGSRHNRIVDDEIYDMGAGGVKVGESTSPSSDADRNYGNVIADNQIHDLGLVFAPGVGILVLQSAQNSLLHNHIHDLFYTAISVGWTWHYGENQTHDNVIAYNDIHDIGKGMLSDMGGIYAAGEQRGSVIRNNLIHDVSSFEYGGYGIYLDEASSYIVVENNIVYQCTTTGFVQSYGRDNIINNNIYAFSRDFAMMQAKAEDHNSFTFEHNIVEISGGRLLGSYIDIDSSAGGHFLLRNNLYHDGGTNDINFDDEAFLKWRTAGHDHGSIVADPLFVNAAGHDFRLRRDSPALKIGFHQIDVSRVGPRTRSGAGAW